MTESVKTLEAEPHLSAPERLVRQVAYRTTRRKLLRRAGGVIGLGGIASSGLFDPFGVDVARADACSPNPRYDAGAGRICGPSRPCPAARCEPDGSGNPSARCRSNQYVRYQTGWGTFHCASGNPGNHVHCWCTCYEGDLWRCCDCCMKSNPGSGSGRCLNCPGNDWYSCICKHRFSNTC